VNDLSDLEVADIAAKLSPQTSSGNQRRPGGLTALLSHSLRLDWIKGVAFKQADCCVGGGTAMMMMIIHQVRHGRQDNHATNHVRCAETSRAKQSTRHIEATKPNIARFMHCIPSSTALLPRGCASSFGIDGLKYCLFCSVVRGVVGVNVS
jgi:hypothetical protein